jgi:hypothetical protein
MAEETYNEFKVRVTDGKNLTEVDPIELYDELKSERYDYVNKLKQEHRAAIMARHTRVTKRPKITSQVSAGEVVNTEEAPLVTSTDDLQNSSNECPPMDIDYLREKNREKELEVKTRAIVFKEMIFGYFMGIFSGVGIYFTFKEIWSLLIKGVFTFIN